MNPSYRGRERVASLSDDTPRREVESPDSQVAGQPPRKDYINRSSSPKKNSHPFVFFTFYLLLFVQFH